MIDLKKQVEAIKNAQNDLEKQGAKIEAVRIIAKIFEPEAQEFVKLTEAKFATTQNHYGDYMHFLGGFTGLYRLGMIGALKNAGASEGLDNAINIVNG